jgi:hypothetical protein
MDLLAGDILTDCIQALSLIVDSDFRFRATTWHYGVAILSVMWAPAPIAFLHWNSGAATTGSGNSRNSGRAVVEGNLELVPFSTV